jgi:hypothetical protein
MAWILYLIAHHVVFFLIPTFGKTGQNIDANSTKKGIVRNKIMKLTIFNTLGK